MTLPLRQRLQRGLAANGLSQAVNLLIQLGGVPIFLIYWGAPLYGEWLILFAIPAYLVLSDVGFVTASSHEMAMHIARGDRDSALEVFQSTWALVSLVSLILFSVLALLIYLLPNLDWLNLERIPSETVKFVLLILCLHMLAALQCTVLYLGYFSEGKYGVGTTYLALIRLFEFSLTLAAVVTGQSLEITALSYLGGRVIGLLVLFLVLHRDVPWIEVGIKRAKWHQIRRLFRPSLAFMGFSLGHALNIQGIVIIIGATISPTAVVIFSTLRTLTRIVIQFIHAIHTTVRPEISRAFGSNDFDLLRELHSKSCQAAIWLGGFSVIFLASASPLIVEYWTGGRIAIAYPFFTILLAIVFTNAIWWGSLNVQYATNLHQGISVVYLIVNVGVVAATYPLAQKYGLTGAALAMLSAELFLGGYTIRKTLKLLSEGASGFLTKSLRPPLFLINHAVQLIRK